MCDIEGYELVNYAGVSWGIVFVDDLYDLRRVPFHLFIS